MFRFGERLLCPVALACLSVSSCTPAAPAAPAIELSAVPDAAEGGTGRLGSIAGLVRGARPGDHVVIYAHSGMWWVQPYAAQPLTDIAADGSWSSQIHLGTEYAALLVDAGYKPPPKIDTLPAVEGGVRAVVTRKGAGTLTERPRKTIAFSGYEWDVRRSPSDRGGANDYDPENAWVDDAGALHLKIARRGDQWTSAEVALTRPLGYGTYVFVVRLPPDLEPAAAFSLITWDDEGVEQNHRELDVEMSRWGDPRTANTQYVVQPYYVAANVHRFTSPAGRLTHSFRWEPGRASFRSFRGADAAGDHPIARHEFTAGVPTPGNERVRVNLYYFRYSPVPLETEVEVVVERFQYLP